MFKKILWKIIRHFKQTNVCETSVAPCENSLCCPRLYSAKSLRWRDRGVSCSDSWGPARAISGHSASWVPAQCSFWETSRHLVWQHATAWLYNPSPERALGCLPISLADKASDGGQTVPGSSSQCRSDSCVVCACASCEGCLLILCSFSSLPSLWPDWDSWATGRHLWAWEWCWLF